MRDPQIELCIRLKELAAVRIRCGYRRLHVLLRREGRRVKRERIYRLYREEGLSIRAKTPRRRLACRYRTDRPQIDGPNQVWAMDFISDTLFDGWAFRILMIADCRVPSGLSVSRKSSAVSHWRSLSKLSPAKT